MKNFTSYKKSFIPTLSLFDAVLKDFVPFEDYHDDYSCLLHFNLKDTKYELFKKNTFIDVPRLIAFFLFVIIIWFEGKGTITVYFYCSK